ncbi:Hydrophobic seed protein domain-containing protein [Hirschfeldia incana]|nr:Hydrophobic seed protein domain-containing protein [Hirschfeldia incana]
MAPRITLALFLSLNFLFFTYTSALGTCPKDTLEIGLCANVLNLVNIVLGYSPVKPCCSLIYGLADLEAAACLCAALKVNVLGIKLNLPIYVNALLNNCGHTTQTFYPCA